VPGSRIEPESAALRYARTMVIRVVQFTDDWALRDLRLCVREEARLPSFARLLLDYLRHSGND